MLRRVNIQNWQQVTEADFNNFGIYPQQTFDAILSDLGPGFAFSGFGVVQSGPASVVLGPGRLYTLPGPVFYLGETNIDIDFLANLPVVARRWAAITVWGQEIETSTEPRTFLTDATSRATVARVVSTETRRHVNYAVVYGIEAPDPPRPVVAQNILAIAFVLLSNAGVVSIQMNEDARAESLLKLGQRAYELDTWRTRTGTRLDTLASDLTNLANRLLDTAKLGPVLDLMRDMARVKETMSLPADYSAWSADHFLTYDQSEQTHVDFLAKVEEGIRFAPAAERYAQLALLNQFESSVVVQNNFVLPRYTEAARLEVVGNDAELSVAQYMYQTITWRQLARTRLRVRFGTPFWWCSNGRYWYDTGNMEATTFNWGQDLLYDPVRNIFTRRNTGETFNIVETVQHTPTYAWVRLQQYWEDEIIDSYYWEAVSTTESVNGSVVAQTFLVSQEGWMTSVELFFTRVAGDGDINVLICETSNGAPVFDRVIARMTKPVGQLRSWPESTKVDFIPVYLKKDRYALVIQSVGNHFVSLVEGNKFAQGSLFHSTDGAWAMGDLTRDIAFRLNFAQFANTRVAVQLTPIELQNGIAALDINVDSTRPGACETTFEVQVAGIWTPLAAYEINPLNNLPPLLPLRVVFTGTTDVMPGIGLGPNSEVYTWRPRTDFRHVSTIMTIPTPVNTVYVDILLEQWEGSPNHTCTVELLTGAGYGTHVTPAVVDDKPDPAWPFVVTRQCTFTFATPITTFRILVEGTTSNPLNCYHVAERVQVSLFI